MARPQRSTPEQIRTQMKRLPGWRIERKVLKRDLRFRDFETAIAFVRIVARIASRLGHHPDIDIRYDVLRFALTTHDARGLSALDFALAKRIATLGRIHLAKTAPRR
jgi:4a-hydroxytetrahydrobiopterin dehydratase